MRAALASLPRTVWLLGAISLLNDAASDMIYPLVPLYVASVLMAGPKALGWIEGVVEQTDRAQQPHRFRQAGERAAHQASLPSPRAFARAARSASSLSLKRASRPRSVGA